jgi:hypothetical protein
MSSVEEAEREHCVAAAKDTAPWVEAYAERVYRERAAARAESATKIAELDAALDAKHAQLVSVADKLRAERAESAACLDAQIARADKQHLRAIELDAKLTALREAAKIFIDSDWDGEAVGTFAAAIEATE